jgi:hypothetical protein
MTGLLTHLMLFVFSPEDGCSVTDQYDFITFIVAYVKQQCKNAMLKTGIKKAYQWSFPSASTIHCQF